MLLDRDLPLIHLAPRLITRLIVKIDLDLD